MITPQMMLDWSVSWMPVAEDGFKCEMIWLADYYNLTSHPAVNGLSFAAPEWEYFAFRMMPSVYRNPNRRNQYGRQFEALQEQAIYNIGSNNPDAAIAPGDDNNLIMHKVVWANHFGRKLNHMEAAEPFLNAALNDPSDDVHAKNTLALRIMGETVNTTRINFILAATEIIPQTYHQQLCSLITKGI